MLSWANPAGASPSYNSLRDAGPGRDAAQHPSQCSIAAHAHLAAVIATSALVSAAVPNCGHPACPVCAPRERRLPKMLIGPRSCPSWHLPICSLLPLYAQGRQDRQYGRCKVNWAQRGIALGTRGCTHCDPHPPLAAAGLIRFTGSSPCPLSELCVLVLAVSRRFCFLCASDCRVRPEHTHPYARDLWDLG
jgi:hypothetical protein